MRVEEGENEDNIHGTDRQRGIFCVDGTIVEVEGKGWMEVRGGEESGLQVLVPEGVGNEGSKK